MAKALRGAGRPQMRAPIGLATAHAHALPASIAFDYPFATLRSGPYWHAMRRDLGLDHAGHRRKRTACTTSCLDGRLADEAAACRGRRQRFPIPPVEFD